MRHTSHALLAALCMATALPAMADQSEQPIITIKTTAYENYGTANIFVLYIGSDTATDYIDVDCGFGLEEAEIKPWTVTDGNVSATAVPCTVSEAGVVKIYGDPSIIDYFSAIGCNIETIDFAQCTSMTVLNLSHNELKSLDLTPFQNLYSIDLTDNPFTAASPLKIGAPKPNLAILDIDIIDYLDPEFNLSDYPSMVAFSGYANKSLFNIDPTGCPLLQRLSLDSTPVESVDISQNPELKIFNISDTRVTQVDLSKATKLSEFYASHMSGFINKGYKLSTVDLSANPALTVLMLGGNNMSQIDISANPALFDLDLSYNNLTSINIDNNPALYNFNLAYNHFDFATLPLPTNDLGEDNFFFYKYRQQPIEVSRSIAAGTTLDFSGKILREGTTTAVSLYKMSYNVAPGDSPYQPITPDAGVFEYADGKITFHTALEDSIYVSFDNDAFPEAYLRTTPFMVKSPEDYGRPSPIIKFDPDIEVHQPGSQIAFSVGIDGASPSSPKTFYVDFGDGMLLPYVCISEMPESPNVVANLPAYPGVIVYVVEGDVMCSFEANGIKMDSFSPQKATELRRLTVANADLDIINISYNRCLKSLDLSGNQLENLEFAGVNGEYEKYVLNDVNLSHNKLSQLTLVSHQNIHNLDISYNLFEEFPYTDWDYLQSLNISHNLLSEANLSYLVNATTVDCSANNISKITLPATNVFASFDCSDNALTFAELPLLEPTVAYTYAPQKQITIPTKGPGVNLSQMQLDLDGQNTTFTWMLASDGTEVPASDLRINGGVTAFLNANTGRIYCQMTHPRFPDFTGDNAYTTTVIETAGKPDHLLATFTTPVGGQEAQLSLAALADNTSIYIDWEGSLSAFEQYQLTTTYRRFSATTTEGATVTVWSYNDEDLLNVFSIMNTTMDSFDGSPMHHVYTFNLSGNSLPQDAITYPDKQAIGELSLTHNQFTEFDPSEFPNLVTLYLSANQLSTFNLDGCCPQMVELSLSANQLTTATVKAPLMFNLNLEDNLLTTVDLTGLPDLQLLAISGNQLSELSLTRNRHLMALFLDRNLFTLATLPQPKSNWVLYTYANQAPIEAPCVDGKVDLSSQAKVGTTATDYKWYLGEPTLNDEGELEGEELIIDEEYTLADGVTTFLTDLSGMEVMCVMTNTVFPNATFSTPLMTINLSDIKTIGADMTDATITRQGENITVEAPSMADGTQVVLINAAGQTVAAARMSGHKATLSGVLPGAYIVTVGTKAFKIAL